MVFNSFKYLLFLPVLLYTFEPVFARTTRHWKDEPKEEKDESLTHLGTAAK